MLYSFKLTHDSRIKKERGKLFLLSEHTTFMFIENIEVQYWILKGGADLVLAMISGEARHGDKGSSSSEKTMEAFFFMALAMGLELGAV